MRSGRWCKNAAVNLFLNDLTVGKITDVSSHCIFQNRGAVSALIYFKKGGNYLSYKNVLLTQATLRLDYHGMN